MKNLVIGTKTLAAEILNRFQKWLVSPDGERKDTKTAKQHVAQVKNILAIVDEGSRLESLLDVIKIRNVFLSEHADEKLRSIPQPQ